MKCLRCGKQMLRCQYTGGGVYWFCSRCDCRDESTSNSKDGSFTGFLSYYRRLIESGVIKEYESK